MELNLIHIGRLDVAPWSQWFEEVTVKVEGNKETLLRCQIADQAALYGLLSRLRDLALPLLSVNLSQEANHDCSG